MQKAPEAPDRKRGDACSKEKELSRQKQESCPLSAVTSGVTTPKSFLLVVEGTMRPSLDDALTKTHQIMDSSESQLRHNTTDFMTTTENTGFRHIS